LGGSLAGKHLEFEPRVNEALRLSELVEINAMMDISDGLSSDLNRICTQSKVGAVIEVDKIPVSQVAEKSAEPLNAALNDGEDFELLFTLSAKQFEILKTKWDMKVGISAVGTITQEEGMKIKMPDGEIHELLPAGFDHLNG
jgi:thiamine-monophosphate kinase